MIPRRRVDFAGRGFLEVSEDEREARAPYALELGCHDQSFRIVAITDVDLALLAIEIANIPAVKAIIAGGVELDRRNRPERYR